MKSLLFMGKAPRTAPPICVKAQMTSQTVSDALRAMIIRLCLLFMGVQYEMLHHIQGRHLNMRSGYGIIK